MNDLNNDFDFSKTKREIYKIVLNLNLNITNMDEKMKNILQMKNNKNKLSELKSYIQHRK